MRLYTEFDKDISRYRKTFTRYSNYVFNNESEQRIRWHGAVTTECDLAEEASLLWHEVRNNMLFDVSISK